MTIFLHRTSQPHFPYKHPEFGTDSRPKSASFWERTVYYWWWQYLRRNREYLAACETDGNEYFADLYADFGDVRSDDFKSWWLENDRGIKLFAEPSGESIRILEAGEVALNSNEFLTLSAPLYLSKKIIEKQVREILVEYHKGKRGHQNAKKSKAKYKISGQPNVSALRQGLIVYDYWKAHPELTLWEIGNELPSFQIEHKIKRGDTQAEKTAKKNTIAATVGRYNRRVKTSIERAGSGVFP